MGAELRTKAERERSKNLKKKPSQSVPSSL